MDEEYVKLYNTRTNSNEWFMVQIRSDVLASSVLAWLDQHCEGENMMGLVKVLFKDERDALMFKMATY